MRLAKFIFLWISLFLFALLHWIVYPFTREGMVDFEKNSLGWQITTSGLLLAYIIAGSLVGLLIAVLFRLLALQQTKFNSAVVTGFTLFSLLPARFFGYAHDTPYSVSMSLAQIVIVYAALLACSGLVTHWQALKQPS